MRQVRQQYDNHSGPCGLTRTSLVSPSSSVLLSLTSLQHWIEVYLLSLVVVLHYSENIIDRILNESKRSHVRLHLLLVQKDVRKKIVSTSSSCCPSSASPCSSVSFWRVPYHRIIQDRRDLYDTSRLQMNFTHKHSRETKYNTVLHTIVLRGYTDTVTARQQANVPVIYRSSKIKGTIFYTYHIDFWIPNNLLYWNPCPAKIFFQFLLHIQ